MEKQWLMATLAMLISVWATLKKAIEYHTQRRNIAKELGDKIGERKACFRLGCDHVFSGAYHHAVDYFRAIVELLNDVRALLQSEDVWKINFRTLCQDAYNAIWRTLIQVSSFKFIKKKLRKNTK